MDLKWLRFHPECYYKPNRDAALETHPAIIAAVTDLAGAITGALRIYLDPYEATKADLEFRRLSMGNVLGHGIRLGQAHDVMAAGEGLETMLSLRSLMPLMPMVAATSASHLGGLLLPPTLKRLYIAVDNDPAGFAAAEQLAFRHIDEELEIRLLISMFDDWNTDLKKSGADFTIGHLRPQLTPLDRLHLQSSWRL